MEAVFGSEELAAFLEHGVAGDGFVFLRAEDEADGGVIAADLVKVFIQADVAVHLADILMGELADFEIDEDEALQEVVVEDEIDAEFVVLEDEAFLPRDKTEAAPEFEQEGLEVVHDGLLQLRLMKAWTGGQAEELEDGR